MTKRAFLLPTFVLLVASCGGGSSSVPFSSLERRYAQELCEYYSRCFAPSGQTNFYGIIADHPGTYGTCTDLAARARIANLGSFQASIDAGRIVYDGSSAATCLARIGTNCTPLDVAGRAEPACARVFQGTVAIGGTCGMDEECAGDAYCDSGATACGGTCTATVGVGSACTSESECADDAGGTMECTTTAQNASPHCVITRYVTAGAGQACGQTDVDGDEQVTTTCGAGLFCKLTIGQVTGNCTYPVAVGASCVQNVDACETDASCTGPLGSRTCHAITMMNDVNDACDEPALIVCNPLNRLECLNNVCTTIGAGTAGEKCRNGMATDCNEGFYCREGGASQDTCTALVANGQPCPDGDSSCSSGYCDDVTTPASPVCAVAACP